MSAGNLEVESLLPDTETNSSQRKDEVLVIENTSSVGNYLQPAQDGVKVLDLEEGEIAKSSKSERQDKSGDTELKEMAEIEEPVVKIARKGSKDKDKDKKKEGFKPVNVFRLFRYATLLDFFLMFCGAIASIGHGFALPALMFVFGDLTNSFINRAISEMILSNSIVNCSATVNSSFVGFSVTDIVDIFTNGSIDFTCDFIVQSNSTYEELIRRCGQNSQCLTNDSFIDIVNLQVYAFVGIAVGVFLLANVQITCLQVACERQVHKIRQLYYRAILRQEIGWFDVNPSGELGSRLSDDIDKIHGGIGDKVALLLQWLATFLGGFIVGFVREWRLTLLLLVFTPFLAIGGFIMSRVIGSFTSREQSQYASAGAVAEEVLSSVRTVVSFGGEYKEVKRYDNKLKDARALGAKKGLSVGLSLAFVFFLIFLVDAAAFWFGGFLISTGVTQGGDVVGVFFAVLIGAFALGQAGPNVEALISAAGAAKVIFGTIDRVPLIDSSSDEGVFPDTFDSTIELKNVNFSYPTRPDIQVLQDFNVKVGIGKTFALVGASGCGKSTVVQIIQRFYDVENGEVLVGGINVRDLNLKWLRSNIGVVSQEPVLFDTSIAENIRYGKEGVTLDDIKRAAKAANAIDFISKLPDGYNTLVGERGTQLSGGQKQRIAIARALVRDPKILLLDEATSALDTESESVVQQALDQAREGRTTIVVAHRLSTIQSADVIVSIDNGQVVEMGTHTELMANKGLYFDLVTAQSYAADEKFALAESTNPRSSLIRRGSRRNNTGSESESVGGGVDRQASLRQQMSVLSDITSEESSKGLKRMASKKLQEEWDKEIPDVRLWRVLRLNLKEWWIILLGLLGAVMNGAIWPMFALLFGEILEVFMRPSSQVIAGTHLWGALFVVLGVVSGVGVFLKTVCFSVSGENLTSRLRSQSFRAMLRQEVGWFDNERNSSGALITRLSNDASQVQGATGARLGTLIETFIGMILGIIIAFVYTWVLTLLILAVVPIVVIAGSLEVKALTGQANQTRKDVETAGKIAVDSIENIRTVASLGIEENFFKQYSISLNRLYSKALFDSFVYGLTYAFSQCVIYFMYGIVFRFGAFQVTLPIDHVAYSSFDNVFVAFTALIFGAAGAGQASAFAPNYAKAKLSANRIFYLLDRVPEIDGYSEDGEKGTATESSAVALSGVNFNYPSRPDVKVLQGLDIIVKPGQTLALVGPSGCGKSTVVCLLERFYDVKSGSVSLDDKDIRDLNIRWLRSQIGVVSQEPILFDTSIAENIRYGANFREVSDEEIIEAAKTANIHKFVETLPQGYNTNVGAKGTQLSGGQKQRVAIARAIIRDPKILVLDEATSALDTESEKIVQDALDKAQKGRTSIVIAHRLSTIYNADCIVVISRGQAVEVGTHLELIENKGIYYRLNRYQMIEKKNEIASDP